MMNKKGFTLIELLVTIALMISILGIAIVNFITISNNKKEASWKEVQNQMKVAAQNYFETNEYLLSGKDSATVSLGMLVSEDYLNVVTNPVTGKKLNKCSYVSVVKDKENGGYNYEYKDSNAITCPQEGYIVLQEAGAPKIDVFMSDNPTGNNSWYVKDVKAKATVSTNNNGPIKEVKYCTSTSKECNNYTNLTLTKDNKYSASTTDGINYATFIATNSSGKSAVGYISYKKDTVNPICSSNTGTTIWTNKDRKITWTCNDTTSGCEKNEYNKTFKTDAKTGTIDIKDNAGNTNTCNANVYVDKTKPTCTMSLEGTVGNKVNGTQWYKSDVIINSTPNDKGGSGIDKYGLATSKNSTNETKSVTQTKETKSITYYGYVKDNAGNENSCSAKFGLEKEVTLTFNVNKTNSTKSYNPNNKSNGEAVFKSNIENVCGFGTCSNINCKTDENKTKSCPKDYFARSCMYVNEYYRYFDVQAISYNNGISTTVKADGESPTYGMKRVESVLRYNTNGENYENTELFKDPYYYQIVGNNSGGRSAFTAHNYQFTSPAGNKSNPIRLYVEYVGYCGY